MYSLNERRKNKKRSASLCLSTPPVCVEVNGLQSPRASEYKCALGTNTNTSALLPLALGINVDRRAEAESACTGAWHALSVRGCEAARQHDTISSRWLKERQR